jgi:predicted ArsR family transcriptional regulator
MLPVSREWTFLSNHGHVLVSLARDTEARMRDVAEAVGITERAVQQIVHDLVDEGYLHKSKTGRRNRYRVVAGAHFRHHLEAGLTLGPVLELVNGPRGGADRG